MAEIAPLNRRATYIAVSSAILSLSRGVGALPGGVIADRLGFAWVFYIAGVVVMMGGLGILANRSLLRRSIKHTETTYVNQSRTGWLPAFIMLILIGIFGFLNISILLTYVPLLGTEVMGISATGVGLIFTVNGLATMAFSVPAGVIADRIGKRTNMISGLALCAVAMGGLALARDFPWVIGLGVVHALGMAFFMTAAISVLADFIPVGRLATYIGLYGGIGENSGLMLGSIIGGFVWDSMGVSATFVTGVIACCVGIFLCLLLKRTLTVPTQKIKIAA
jgi:MFS family permease